MCVTCVTASLLNIISYFNISYTHTHQYPRLYPVISNYLHLKWVYKRWRDSKDLDSVWLSNKLSCFLWCAAPMGCKFLLWQVVAGGSMCATIKQHQTSKETRSVCSIHKAIFQGQGHHDTHGSYAAPQRLKGKTERRMQDRGVIYLHLPAACYCTCWWK